MWGDLEDDLLVLGVGGGEGDAAVGGDVVGGEGLGIEGAKGNGGGGGAVLDAQGIEADACAVRGDLEGLGTAAEQAGVLVGEASDVFVAETGTADAAGSASDGIDEEELCGSDILFVGDRSSEHSLAVSGKTDE